MKNSKLDRALNGPSIFEVTLGMILSVALGACLAAGFLIFQPVEEVKELPKEADRVSGRVYYIEGSIDSSRSKAWRQKQRAFLDGKPGEIALSEEELNAWLASSMERVGPDGKPIPAPKPKPTPPPVKPGKPGDPPPPTPMPDEVFEATPPSFRIRDNALQIGARTKINLLTLSFPVVFQARGGFEKEGDMFKFKPKTVYVGSLPLHRIPGFTAEMMKRVMAAQSLPAEAVEAWKKVTNVVVDGRALKITLP